MPPLQQSNFHRQLSSMWLFAGEKSSYNIVNNETMSDDEAVASDVPAQYLLENLPVSPNFNSINNHEARYANLQM